VLTSSTYRSDIPETIASLLNALHHTTLGSDPVKAVKVCSLISAANAIDPSIRILKREYRHRFEGHFNPYVVGLLLLLLFNIAKAERIHIVFL